MNLIKRLEILQNRIPQIAAYGIKDIMDAEDICSTIQQAQLQLKKVNEYDRLKAIEMAALVLDDVWGFVTIVHADEKFIKARARLAATLAMKIIS